MIVSPPHGVLGCSVIVTPGLEVIKLEYRLNIKPNDWLLADTRQSLHFVLSLRINSSFITSRPYNLTHLFFVLLRMSKCL